MKGTTKEEEHTDEPAPALLAAWTRLLSTSAGAQMVVATVPATRLDSMCVFTSSCNEVFARRARLAAVYLTDMLVSSGASCEPGSNAHHSPQRHGTEKA